jgi:hypothetical protein
MHFIKQIFLGIPIDKTEAELPQSPGHGDPKKDALTPEI